MFARIVAPLALVLLMLGAAVAEARNPAYYGTPRRASARFYSGDFRVQNPAVVPTFTLPAVQGGQFGRFNRFNRFGRPVVFQPVVVYPPAVFYGF